VIALLASPLTRWLLVAGAFAALAVGAYVQTLRLDAATARAEAAEAVSADLRAQAATQAEAARMLSSALSAAQAQRAVDDAAMGAILRESRRLRAAGDADGAARAAARAVTEGWR